MPKANQMDLKEAIQATFKQRKTKVPSSFSSNFRELDTSILEKGWKSSAGYIKEAGSFSEAFEKLISFLSEMGL